MTEKNTAARREDVVQRYLIEHWATHTPDRVFAYFEDGTQLTYAQLIAQVRSTAVGLQALGVRQGDHVLVWLPNGADCLRTWFAINFLGAVCVSINTAYKGGLLEHVVRNSGARLVVTIGALLERLSVVPLAKLESAVVMNGDSVAVRGLQVMGREALQGEGDLQELTRPIEPWDTQCIFYTSGTTGPSKGVLSSYMHLWTMARQTVSSREGELLIARDDRYMEIEAPIESIAVGCTSPPAWKRGRLTM